VHTIATKGNQILGEKDMDNDSYTRKNCLQRGLRILSPKTYFALLRRYAIELSPDAYDQIKKAHMNKRDGCWWYQWLGFEILEDRIWVNIATGRRIAFWYSGNIGKFQTWAAYENFREKLREETAKRLKDNPQLV
jgi:hypothetical protein